MKRLTSTLFVGLFIAATTAIGASPANAGQKVQRPFKSTETGAITAFDVNNCSFDFELLVLQCPQQISAVAQATHLGRSTVESTSDQLTIYVFGEPCVTPEGNPGVPFDARGRFVYVAANGDELYLDTFVQGCGNGVDRAETIGTYTITGGTGRFAGATGVGTSSSTVVQGPSAASLVSTLVGTITY